VTFAYLEPDSLDEAIGRLGELGTDAVAIAGGTAFTLLYNQGLIRPDRVVGLRRLEEMRGIRATADGLWIGALTTHHQVELSPLAAAHHRVIVDTFRKIATIRIRNQATVGGNLAHADPSQDPPPTLIALDAVVVVAGPDGTQREVPLDDFFLDHLTTVLEPAELIVGIRIPIVPSGTRATYVKFLPRTADDYATVAVAVVARRDTDGTIGAIRIVLGAVGSTPIRSRKVEAALLGEQPTKARIDEAAALVRAEIDPIDDARGGAAYKREMARVWVARAVTEVTT
jgi:carbon-monoxide dehydrogenase medium subunit